jgi:DNA (cytosine-5)-methyltransferase 1
LEKKVLSLFSGVGGFDIGFHRAGYRTTFMCEWDKHAVSVLNRHFPEIPKWGDIKTLTGRHILSVSEPPDVVIWGSPCQDLSFSGKKIGLKGERSSLFYEGVRIIKEIKEQTNGKYPKISIWENVCGALSSNKGVDFGIVLDQMAEAGALVQEWRVLDAQYFGVPQRRRRVFLVSVFDFTAAERCSSSIFTIGKSLSGDYKKSKKQIKETTPDVGERFEENSNEHGVITKSNEQSCYSNYNPIIGPLAASDWKFPQQQQVYENKIILWENQNTITTLGDKTHSLTNRVGVTEDGGGRGTPIVATSNTSEMIVRKLTPIECERLMGWPDNWTAGQSDKQRYKQCGNGVVSPVATWIGQNIILLL